jgi:hypothetical protein
VKGGGDDGGGAEHERHVRAAAIRRIKKKSEFKAHVFAYIVVNGFLVGLWGRDGSWHFWPIFPILGWGIGVAFNAWDVYWRAVPTEQQILREMDRLRDPSVRGAGVMRDGDQALTHGEDHRVSRSVGDVPA